MFIRILNHINCINLFTKTKIILNFTAARMVHLNFPRELLKQAKETIGPAPQ